MRKKSYKLTDSEARALQNPPCPKCGGHVCVVALTAGWTMECDDCSWVGPAPFSNPNRGRRKKDEGGHTNGQV
jgi:hypothetical protein